MGWLLRITLVGALLALLGERIVHFCHRARVFKEVEPIDLPNCQLLKGIEFGSEDIDVLPNGLAFISAGLKFPGLKSFAPDKPGQILLLDLNDGDLTPSPLSFSEGFDSSSFNPHGLSTYIDEKGMIVNIRTANYSYEYYNFVNSSYAELCGSTVSYKQTSWGLILYYSFCLQIYRQKDQTTQDDAVYLFVVNHPKLQSIIEIFRFVEEENVLIHLKSIKHELLNSVNDIIAVGPESFYATNDYYFSNLHMKYVELLIGLSWTGVVYYSPGDVRHVATGFYSGNGITISNDKQYIYAADASGHTINVFKRNTDWSLSPVKVVDLDTIVDNLSVDPVTGDIWTGAHPNGYKFFVYKEDDPPYSEVVRVQNILSNDPIITKVYVDNGSVIQGSSSASVYKGQLLVGTVYHRALHCQLE